MSKNFVGKIRIHFEIYQEKYAIRLNNNNNNNLIALLRDWNGIEYKVVVYCFSHVNDISTFEERESTFSL